MPQCYKYSSMLYFFGDLQISVRARTRIILVSCITQAAYADCGTRRGRAEMRGVYPKITPLLPFGLRTGRSTLRPKLVRARGQAHSPSRRAASGDTPPPRATETASRGGRVKNQRPLRRTQDQAPSGPAQG